MHIYGKFHTNTHALLEGFDKGKSCIRIHRSSQVFSGFFCLRMILFFIQFYTPFKPTSDMLALIFAPLIKPQLTKDIWSWTSKLLESVLFW